MMPLRWALNNTLLIYITYTLQYIIFLCLILNINVDLPIALNLIYNNALALLNKLLL
jgi:hypothetical protein